MLVGWKPGQPVPTGVDPFKPSVTVEELYGSMSGAQLLDSILEFFGDGVRDLNGTQKIWTGMRPGLWSALPFPDQYRKGLSSATCAKLWRMV